jgi:predicted transposase YbfD/YdcC
MMGSLVKECLAVTFDALEDPRVDRSKKYPLQEIVFLAIFAALQGIESWRGIELLGNERLDFLRRFYLFKEGIPSHQTIGRVFSILKPKSFEAFFMAWSAALSGPSAGKQIAIDGKTSRGTYDTASGKQAIHLLNACAVESGIVLGQLEVGAKTNEITAVPEMIDALDIAGAIISGDALITQKDIAAKIIDAKADYNLALKGNHKNLNEEVKYQFDTKKISTGSSNYFSETEKSHGRVHERTYETIDVDDKILPQFSEWKGLKSIGRVSTVVWKQDKETVETRYYLLSYKGAEKFAKSARGHWAVESMHWILDVTFGEDASRKRKDHAPRNYSLVRKFALNVIRTFKGKLSVPLTHIKSSANPEFLTSMLIGSGFTQLEST